MMYGAGYVIGGFVVEAKSAPQQITAEKSGRGSYIGSRKAGRNKQSIIPLW